MKTLMINNLLKIRCLAFGKVELLNEAKQKAKTIQLIVIFRTMANTILQNGSKHIVGRDAYIFVYVLLQVFTSTILTEKVFE